LQNEEDNDSRSQHREVEEAKKEKTNGKLNAKKHHNETHN
tara:strand:+ start:114 stop:233 length:120 start_codon:yes stop_codon:yes gene_type:complete